MKKLILALLATTVFWRVNAADSMWLTDLPAAQAQAKAENKLVLMDFTGSDWCPGCIELKKKVFDTKQFQAYAAKKLVLVEVDFPDKKPQPAALKKANDNLSRKFDVDGYPTQIVLDSNGKEIARKTGYEGESTGKYIDWLEKSAAKR